MTMTMEAPKRAFTLLQKDGRTPLPARIPEHLSVGIALPELAAGAGYASEPSVSTRYALLAAPTDGAGGHGEFTLVNDEARFAELQEHSLLRLAPQPRPASARS